MESYQRILGLANAGSIAAGILPLRSFCVVDAIDYNHGVINEWVRTQITFPNGQSCYTCCHNCFQVQVLPITRKFSGRKLWMIMCTIKDDNCTSVCAINGRINLDFAAAFSLDQSALNHFAIVHVSICCSELISSRI